MADTVAAGENRPPDKADEEDGQGMSKYVSASQQNSGESAEASKVKPGEKRTSEKLGHRRVKGDVVTYKKTPTNMLMLSIQLGLEQSIGKTNNRPKRDLLMQDFAEKEEVEFFPEGSVQTPAHDYNFFKFKTYAPLAFRHFREDFHIKADDFLLSLCNDQLRELSNPGASGSVFYLTNDDEFIIKTLQHKEAKFLRHLLPGYYMNLIQNKRTLLPKFYGLYTYLNTIGSNIRIIVMNNILPSGIKYHEKYDLKGSTFKRNASDKELAKKSPTLKDLDFRNRHPEGISLASDKYNLLMETMRRDTTVLESFKIMDYSLLMGVHNIDQELRDRGITAGAVGASPEHALHDRSGSMVEGAAPTRRQYFSIVQERGHEEMEALPYSIPDGGFSGRNAKGERLVIYIGIIDILQNYRFRKKLEHSFKSIVHEGDTVSVHRPGFYAQRFTDFFSKFVFHPKALVKRKSSSLRRPRQLSAPTSPVSGDQAINENSAKSTATRGDLSADAAASAEPAFADPSPGGPPIAGDVSAEETAAAAASGEGPIELQLPVATAEVKGEEQPAVSSSSPKNADTDEAAGAAAVTEAASVAAEPENSVPAVEAASPPTTDPEPPTADSAAQPAVTEDVASMEPPGTDAVEASAETAEPGVTVADPTTNVAAPEDANPVATVADPTSSEAALEDPNPVATVADPTSSEAAPEDTNPGADGYQQTISAAADS